MFYNDATWFCDPWSDCPPASWCTVLCVQQLQSQIVAAVLTEVTADIEKFKSAKGSLIKDETFIFQI